MTYQELRDWAKSLMDIEQYQQGKRKDWTLDEWIEYLKGETE